MLKTFKWIYDLGVRQERMRIAAKLEAYANRARVSDSTFADMLRGETDKKKPNLRVVNQLKFSRSVNERVGEIVDEIIRPGDAEWVNGVSIMFPDKDNK